MLGDDKGQPNRSYGSGSVGMLIRIITSGNQAGDLQAENRTRSDVFWNAKPYNSGFHYTVVSFTPYLPGSRYGSAVR